MVEEKAPEKRDVYTDSRDEKAAKELDGMEDWDDAKLQEVVNRKKGGQGEFGGLLQAVGFEASQVFKF